MPPKNAQNLAVLQSMMQIRFMEMALADAWDAGEVPGLLHLSYGHEAVAAAVFQHFDPTKDKVTASHRCHAVAIASGMPLDLLANDILGKGTGASKGLGGTQHLSYPKSGFLMGNGIVGGQVPIAAGAALTAKTKKTGGLAVTFLGDGAINQGVVLETMNLAQVLALPLIFIVENNSYGQATQSDLVTAGTIAARADSMNINNATINGWNIKDVSEAMENAVTTARNGKGPTLLEIKVARLDGHYHGDDQRYRSNNDKHAARKQYDPIPLYIKTLTDNGHTKEEIAALEKAVKDEVRAAIHHAKSAAEPTQDTLYKHVTHGELL